MYHGFKSDVPRSLSTSPFLEPNILENWLLSAKVHGPSQFHLHGHCARENDKKEGSMYIVLLMVAGMIR